MVTIEQRLKALENERELLWAEIQRLRERTGRTWNQIASGIAFQGNIGVDGSITKSTALGCRVYCSTSQSINHNTITPVSFDVEVNDEDGCWAIGSPTKFYAKTAGYYIASASCVLNSGDILSVFVRQDGSLYLAQVDSSVDATGSYCRAAIATDYFRMDVNDYIEICVRHHAGSAKNLMASTSTNHMTSGALVRIA